MQSGASLLSSSQLTQRHDCLQRDAQPRAAASTCSSTASGATRLPAAGFGSSSSLGGRQFRRAALQTRGHQQQQRRLGDRGSRLVVHAADYYDVLGVSRESDKKAIKSAYRQLARKFHPDVNKEADAEQKFKEISNAYEVLSDDNKRAIYDRFGEAGLKGGMGGGAGGAPGMDFSNPFDIFETFFGGGMGGMGGMGGYGASGARMRNRPQAGEDQRVEVTLDFLDAVFGSSKEIEIEHLEECETCSGSGVKPGTTPRTCSQCGGSGQVLGEVRTPIGMFQQVSTCNVCNGAGETSTPCSKCSGDGRVRQRKKISLRVPPGVDNGSRLRVRGEGNAGRRGGPPGDLYVFVNVREDPDLRRDGTTIHSDVEVSYIDAILGTTQKIKTVDGLVDLKIPPGTQPGTTLLMRKRGVPRLGQPAGDRGDQRVHVRVAIPQKLSGEEKKLIENLRDLQKQGATKSGWFS